MLSAAPRLLAKPLVQPLGRRPLPKIGAHSRSKGFFTRLPCAIAALQPPPHVLFPSCRSGSVAWATVRMSVMHHTPEEFRRVADELFEETDLLLTQKFLPTEFDWRVGVLAGEPLFVCQYRMA